MAVNYVYNTKVALCHNMFCFIKEISSKDEIQDLVWQWPVDVSIKQTNTNKKQPRALLMTISGIRYKTPAGVTAGLTPTARECFFE